MTGGVHHITFETPNIEASMERLDKIGIPYFGYHEIKGVWKEIFIHPKDSFGVLLQIAEFNADDYLGDEVKIKGGKRWKVEKMEKGCKLHLSHPGGGTVSVELSEEERKQLSRDLES